MKSEYKGELREPARLLLGQYEEFAKHRPWKIDPTPSPEVDLHAALADVNPFLSWENGDFDEIPAEK